MNTQAENEKYPWMSEESHMLAKKAMSEIRSTSKTSVVCPKCHEHPTETTTPKGERTTLKCKCGYIFNVEINL